MSNKILLKQYLQRWVENYYDEESSQSVNDLVCEATTATSALRSWGLIGPSEHAHQFSFDEDFAYSVVRNKVTEFKEQYWRDSEKARRENSITTTSKPRAADLTLANLGEKTMNAMSNFNMPGGDKFMDRLFRKAPGVVWDMMSGKVGIKTNEGIATFAGEGDDAQIDINLFDQFGMEVPAFAQSTPVAAVNVGDLIYFGSGDKPGWIIEKRYGVKPTGSSTPTKKRPTKATTVAGPTGELTVAEEDIDKSNVSFTLMKVDGQRTTWKPPKVSMLGMGGADGVMVIRSLLTMLPGGQNDLNGMQSNMMMMMQMSAMSGNEGGLDMERMMPLMLMGAMGGQGGGGNMMQTMMMMQMLGGGTNLFGNTKPNNGPKGPFNR